jgi:hypothetical protein
MKLLLVLISVAACALPSFAAETVFGDYALRFEKDWDSALEKAKAEDKGLFVYVHGTGCGYNDSLYQNLVFNQELADSIHRYYVPYKLDYYADSLLRAELSEAYMGYVLIYDDGLKLQHKALEFQDTEGYLEMIREVRDNVGTIGWYNEEYANGRRDLDFLTERIMLFKEKRHLSGSDLEQYLVDLSSEDLSRKKAANTVHSNILYYGGRLVDFDSPVVDYYINNRPYYIEEYGVDQADVRLWPYAIDAYGQALKAKDREACDKYLSRIKMVKTSGLHMAIDSYTFDEASGDTTYYAWIGYEIPEYNEEKYRRKQSVYFNDEKDVLELLDNSLSSPASTSADLNFLAWQIFRARDEPQLNETALRLSERSIELEENLYNLDTYANLLHKLGRNEEARKFALLAIEKAKEEEYPSNQIEDLLADIESSMVDK